MEALKHKFIVLGGLIQTTSELVLNFVSLYPDIQLSLDRYNNPEYFILKDMLA